jgi:hypothetical protein
MINAGCSSSEQPGAVVRHGTETQNLGLGRQVEFLPGKKNVDNLFPELVMANCAIRDCRHRQDSILRGKRQPASYSGDSYRDGPCHWSPLPSCHDPSDATTKQRMNAALPSTAGNKFSSRVVKQVQLGHKPGPMNGFLVYDPTGPASLLSHINPSKKNSLMSPLAFGSCMISNNRATHADRYSGTRSTYTLAFQRPTLAIYFKPLGQ